EVADAVWDITNTGNTTAAYNFLPVLASVPDDVTFQLLIYRVYTNPANQCVLNPNDPYLVEQNHELLANITNPAIVNLNPAANATNAAMSSATLDEGVRDVARQQAAGPIDQGQSNSTFHLAPGERAKLALRVFKSGGKTPLALAAAPDRLAAAGGALGSF